MNTNHLANLMHIAALALALVLIFWWAFTPRRYVPWFRPQQLNLRLFLRLHPGRGFVTAYGIWLRWGRFASWRESGRTRADMTVWQRIFRPSQHSVFCGRAQYRMGLRMTIQEHLLALGPPRMFKSGFLASLILRFPGSVVSTSTKADMFMLTSGVRRLRRHPVYVFNPQGIGGYLARSTVRWNPVKGCEVESVAMRRAQAFCEAVSTHGASDDAFWQEQSANMMRGFLCAAALVPGGDMRLVAHWILSGQVQQAEKILEDNKRYTWARTIAQMRGPAERTTATIRMVLASAIGFMADPELASCVLPGPGDEFDLIDFLLSGSTLYLIGQSRGTTSPIAPLFAALASEAHFQATLLAGNLGGRMNPPMQMNLDEVTQICPLPVPSLLADSGGIGVQMIVACHGVAQLRARWGADGARSILDTSNVMLVPGVSDPDTLRMASERCDMATYRVRGKDDGSTVDVPVVTPGMITRICRKRGLIMRSNLPPVITRLPLAWRSLPYRLAKLSRQEVALPPAAAEALHFRLPAPRQMAPRQSQQGTAVGIDPGQDREPQLVPDLEAEMDQ